MNTSFGRKIKEDYLKKTKNITYIKSNPSLLHPGTIFVAPNGVGTKGALELAIVFMRANGNYQPGTPIVAYQTNKGIGTLGEKDFVRGLQDGMFSSNQFLGATGKLQTDTVVNLKNTTTSTIKAVKQLTP
jgi:hypothetical protein